MTKLRRNLNDVCERENNITCNFRELGEREGAVIPLNSLRGYTDPLALKFFKDN
jgi:hypothetical protein